MVPCLRVGVGGEYRAYQMRLVEKPAKSDTFGMAKQDYLEDILRMMLHFRTSWVYTTERYHHHNIVLTFGGFVELLPPFNFEAHQLEARGHELQASRLTCCHGYLATCQTALSGRIDCKGISGLPCRLQAHLPHTNPMCSVSTSSSTRESNPCPLLHRPACDHRVDPGCIAAVASEDLQYSL